MIKRAFVVGINEYQLHPLQQCVRDAEDMAQLLREPDYYNFEVTLCTNEHATLRSLRSGLDQLLASKPDIALFYFAGHGFVTDLGGYLVTSDYLELDDPGLSLEMLSRVVQVRSHPETAVVVILDCCHSGLASLRNISADARQMQWRALTNEAIMQSVKIGQGRVILAACLPNESAYEFSREGHGLFTYHLLDALMGEAANNEGHTTPTSVYDYIAAIFANIKLQTPVFRGDISGRIVLGKGFPARQEELNTSEQREVAAKAHYLMDEYVRAISALSNDEDWRKMGYIQACARLEAIIDWQRTKTGESRILKDNKEFQRAIERTTAELSRLGMLYSGIFTHKGQITEKLGSGTFGTVWKVTTERNEIQAYKVYNSVDLSLTDKLTRFKRGYLAMKRLDHPQVVKVSDFTECPIGFYMDYVDGPNLRDFVGIEQSISDKMLIMVTIADTLRHAHDRGVVHRDVKPENILMRFELETERWVPLLSDFDLAWFSAASQVTRVGIGAFAYAAPEQFAQPGAAIAHAATTDVYAFGQLAYFILTNSDPVPGSIEENARILKQRLADWPNSEAARRVIELYRRCSQYKPQERYGAFDDIMKECLAVLQILQDHRNDARISVERFLDDVKTNVIGLHDDKNDGSQVYYSRSGITRISVETRSVDYPIGFLTLNVDFWPQNIKAIAGASHKDGQAILLRRVDSIIRELTKVRRVQTTSKNGTIVRIEDLPINFIGSKQAAYVINRLIEAIEN